MTKKKEFLERDLFKMRNHRKANPNLSAREHEVLRLLLEFFNYREIAEQLNISKSTVRFHVARIVGKLHFENRLDLLRKSLIAASKPDGVPNDPLQRH